MTVEQLAFLQRGLMMNVRKVLLLIVDAELTLERPSVDRIRLLVDRSFKVLHHRMSFHEVRLQVGSVVQLIDGIHIARWLRDDQIGVYLFVYKRSNLVKFKCKNLNVKMKA